LLALTVFQLLWLLVLWSGAAVGLRFAGLHSYQGWCVLFCAASAFALLLLASGPEAVARFRIPAVPLVAVIAAVGWTSIGRGLPPERRAD
jgi:hypothetical protein